MNGVPPDHNAARWLTVKYLDGVAHPRRRRDGEAKEQFAEGWHVVRTCPCHFGESVSVALPSEERAEQTREAMLSVSGA
jgi:hypothetical protein